MSLVPAPQETARRRRAGNELARADRGLAPRVEVLSTFNVDLLPPLLVEALDRTDIVADVHAGPFGQLSQQVLDPGSAFYAADPAEVVVIPAAEDLLESLFVRPPSELKPEAAAALVESRLVELEHLVGTILDRLPTTICYVVVFGSPRAPHAHLLDPRAPDRGQAAIERFVDGVRGMGAVSARVVVVDWDWEVRTCGWDAVRDDRLWYLGRMRLSPGGCAALADLVALHAAAYRGRVRKVVALDLDGLLWGGVIGEVGLSGIEIGEDGVGRAFQDLQRDLLILRDSGVLLVSCSKNNPGDAAEVFERHPGMVLRREHFAAERVNWQDKASNLRELAEELDLGLDSFVFLDDNPVERTWVRLACPEVLVPDVAEDPVARPAQLRAAPWFARVATTAADRRRAAIYGDQRERRRLQESADTFETFLSSLAQEALVAPVDGGSLARAVQLSQRTNQFNLTTKRYTLADMERLLGDEEYDLFTLAVRDRFGDSGITGLAILRNVGEETTVDTLLLSCRVLGRRIEDAFLAFLAESAAAHGAAALVGLFEPTAKNAQVATFYSDRGFAPAGPGRFRLDLRQTLPGAPSEIAIRVGSSG